MTLVRDFRERAVAALACLLAATGPSLAGTDGTPQARANVAPNAARSAAAVAPARTRDLWRGENIDALTQASWRWLMSIPPGVSPIDAVDGVNCGINQQGPFWFVGGPIGQSFSTTCTIPAGTAIVVPVNAYLDDYPCPNPAFKPAVGQSLESFLQGDVAGVIDTVSLAEAQLDGKPLRARRVTTGLFPFTGADGLTGFDPCVTGSPQVGVSDGYWVFIDPLPRGDHSLLLRSVNVFGSTQGTYTLKIR